VKSGATKARRFSLSVLMAGLAIMDVQFSCRSWFDLRGIFVCNHQLPSCFFRSLSEIDVAMPGCVEDTDRFSSCHRQDKRPYQSLIPVALSNPYVIDHNSRSFLYPEKMKRSQFDG